MSDNDWIEWHGGECPVPPDSKVMIRFGHETREEAIALYKAHRKFAYANTWAWSQGKQFDGDDEYLIVEYRVMPS